MLLAPLFLLGLLAISAPLWIHRFARQTDERQPFASLMLLEASEVRRTRRHTLRYLALLALRIGLIVALAFAFAQPMLPWRVVAPAAGQPRLHVIVLDTSLSMQEGQRWQRAQAQVQKLIGALAGGDRAMLVAADHRIRVIQEPVGTEGRESLRGALAGLRPALTRLDYGMLMTSAEAWIGSRNMPTELHLITDLQQSASPLRFADLEPPAGVNLQLHDVGGGGANLYVADVRSSSADLNTLEVRVEGPADAPARELSVQIDAQERARRAIPAGGTASRRLSFPNLALGPGDHRVSVMLEPRDSLPQDDVFHAVLERDATRVLIVTAPTAGDDAAYLAAAIGSLTSPRIAVERATLDTLDRAPLADYAALVISDVGILSEAATTAVSRYLEAGGTALVTLGAQAAGLRRLPLSGHEVASASLGEERSAAARVSVVDESHAVLREAQGWRSIRFLRHVPIEPQADDSVLIRFESGPPLLLERRSGSGRLLVFTSPLDREWNDLAIHPLFVRFVGEAVRYLTRAGTTTSGATVGEPFNAVLSGRAEAQVFDPRGQRVLTLGATTGGARLLPDQPGFYEVRGGGRARWLAANVDPRESDQARFSSDTVERWQSLRPSAPVAAASQTPEAPRLLPIWLWFMLAAAALAFMEGLVANYHLGIQREQRT